MSLAWNNQRNTQTVLAYFNPKESTKKHINTICAYQSQGTYREICEHNSHISLTTEFVEKYANTNHTIHPQRTYSEIRKHSSRTSLPKNPQRNTQT